MLLPWPMMAIVDQALGGTPPARWIAALPGVDPQSRQSLLVAFVVLGFIIQMAHQAVLMMHTRIYTVTGHLVTRDLRQSLRTAL